MLRLAETRDEVRVVHDQQGTPSSAIDIAAAIEAVAHNLVAHPQERKLRGVFHLASQGKTNWAEFAATIFTLAAERGLPAARVVPITTAEYPTPSRRPAFSYLDTSKLDQSHRVRLPPWREGLVRVMDRLAGGGV